MAHYVYILYSEKSYHFYVGSTSNTEERIHRHNAGATPSTKQGRPWKIVYTEIFTSKTEALQREIYLKRMKSRVYLEDLISKKN